MNFNALYNIHEVVQSSRELRSNSRALIQLTGRRTRMKVAYCMNPIYLARYLRGVLLPIAK